jgi:dipeptidyl aminopeptidase/acylaminoacyl peptidase
MHHTRTAFFIILFLTAASALAQVNTVLTQETTPRRAMTIEDMYALGRVSDPQVSPDGSTVLYVVTTYSIPFNSSNSDIWAVPLKGDTTYQLTSSLRADFSPRWSPDGRSIAFISSRDGSPQLWLMNPDGSSQHAITSISTGVDALAWSPTGTHLLFTSSVYADCNDDDCNAKRDKAKSAAQSKARISERIPYRVWNSWKDDKFSHLFVMPVGGKPVDVTPGEYDTPPIDIGGHQDFTVSPDGSEIAFVRNTDKLVAASTNNDVWLMNLDGSRLRCITPRNTANDNNPVYSPNGRYIAYRSMSRPGYEADKYDLKIYDRKLDRVTLLTRGFDRSVDEIIWSHDSKRILFTAPDGGYVSLFEVPTAGGDILRVLKGVVTVRFKHDQGEQALELGTLRNSFSLLANDSTLVFVGQRANYPAEVMTAVYTKGQVRSFRQLTKTNSALIDQLDLREAESFTFKGADNTPVQGWIVRPPNFDENKKYPMIFIVHGGPQGYWGDEFHYRWNMQLFAAPGYVIVAVNPRGSQGFGQAFTDGVNGDWGGKPYQDLMKGLDYVLAKYKFIDKDRIGAAGASYGGYMMDWMLGHTNRFKAIFTHSGVYDLKSMWGGTEELWFPEWEFRGTPWTNPTMYEKWSPSSYAKNFKTPTLVSHGQLDFRVPVEQSMQLFSTLQRLGVSSRFIYFPDEGHTILKPANAKLWYDEFHAWFKKWLMVNG